jgi:Phasin protein
MQSLANNPALISQFQTQMDFITELSQKTVDLVRQLSEINMHMARQMAEDTMNASREMMSCSDPVQMTTIAMNQTQPAMEHLRSYQQQLVSALSGGQLDLARSGQAQRAAIFGSGQHTM